MTEEDGDDPTLVICIRCAQMVPARAQCAFCADLDISIEKDSTEEGDPERPWLFVVWERPSQGEPTRVVTRGGFSTPADARARAHELIRFYVAERRARPRRRR